MMKRNLQNSKIIFKKSPGNKMRFLNKLKIKYRILPPLPDDPK